MPGIPRDRSLDSTLALLRDPYAFVAKRCRRYGSDLFETRLLLRKTICITGPRAAELLCDPSRFLRQGAMPERIRKTLLGRGGVQGLDGEAHRHRKRMFMSIMTPARIQYLGQLVNDQLVHAARNWTAMERIILYDELHEVLTRAVCAWCGISLPEKDVRRRARELAAMFDYAGSIGPKHWWSRVARGRAERWIEKEIAHIRDGTLDPFDETAARIIATHKDLKGQLLNPRVAAVELINILRPTVAIAVFITFAAHAFHKYPECRRRIAGGEEGYAELFVQEVRRWYPFFPAVAARVKDAFVWEGYPFPKGRTVMLDLFGTNHDPRTWDAPSEFRPERFRGWNGSAFSFIPQGPGDHFQNHRCPGEWITIALMKVAVDFLTRRITYALPEQDLEIDRSRLPALPRSRVIISNVRIIS